MGEPATKRQPHSYRECSILSFSLLHFPVIVTPPWAGAFTPTHPDAHPKHKHSSVVDYLIVMIIIKFVATRCQISTLRCIKFNFPLGELTALPQSLAGFKRGGLFLREGRQRCKEWEGRGNGRGGKEWGEKEG